MLVVVKQARVYLKLRGRWRRAGGEPVFTDTCGSRPPCQHRRRAALHEINVTAAVDSMLLSLRLGRPEPARDDPRGSNPKFLPFLPFEG